MSADHVDLIDCSVEKAHVWLKDLAEELGGQDQRYAYRVLRAFLHEVRDRLSGKGAANSSAARAGGPRGPSRSW